MSVNQAAAQLGISSALMRRLCQRGKVKAVKVGRDWVVNEASLRHYVPPKRGGPIKGKRIKAASVSRQKRRVAEREQRSLGS